MRWECSYSDIFTIGYNYTAVQSCWGYLGCVSCSGTGEEEDGSLSALERCWVPALKSSSDVSGPVKLPSLSLSLSSSRSALYSRGHYSSSQDKYAWVRVCDLTIAWAGWIFFSACIFILKHRRVWLTSSSEWAVICLHFFSPFMPPTETFINHSYCYYRHHLLQPASWALTFTSFNNTMPNPSPRYCLSLSLRLSFALSLFLLLSHSSTFLFLISCLCHLCLWKFDNGFLFFLSVNPPAHLSLSEWHTRRGNLIRACSQKEIKQSLPSRWLQCVYVCERGRLCLCARLQWWHVDKGWCHITYLPKHIK